MKTRVFASAAIVGLILSGSAAIAPVLAAEPVFSTILLEQVVNRTPDQAWARIGAYCAIAEWGNTSCRSAGGNSVSVGAQRRLGDGGDQIMVGRTDHSYTYTGVDAPVLYYGTLAVEPMDRGRKTKIVYTLFHDVAALTAPDARRADRDARSRKMAGALDKMKELAEAP